MVEIDSAGVHVSVRLKVIVNNWFDPTLDLDLTARLGASAGKPTVWITDISAKVDVDFWPDPEVNESALTAAIESRLRSQLDEEISPLTDAGFKVLDVDTVTDAIVIVACR